MAYECDAFGQLPIPSMTYLAGCAAVTEELKAKLEVSGLRTSAFVPVEIIVDQSSAPGAIFFVWRFLGRNCQRAHTIVSRENACPWCGREPLICPVCQTELSLCPQCGKSCMIAEGRQSGSDDPRFTFQLGDRDRPILEGRLWDGSDLFGLPGQNFVTRRAVDFLLSTNAGPFIAKPVRVDVTGMTDQQMEGFEAARKFI